MPAYSTSSAAHSARFQGWGEPVHPLPCEGQSGGALRDRSGVPESIEGQPTVDVAMVDLGAVLELPYDVVLQVIDGIGCDFHR